MHSIECLHVLYTTTQHNTHIHIYKYINFQLIIFNRCQYLQYIFKIFETIIVIYIFYTHNIQYNAIKSFLFCSFNIIIGSYSLKNLFIYSTIRNNILACLCKKRSKYFKLLYILSQKTLFKILSFRLKYK